MVTPKQALLGALALVAIVFTIFWWKLARRHRSEHGGATVGGTAIGFITNFFDTLGIGSFATTTSIYRGWRLVADEKVPGTLNVGHAWPTFVQAFIYTQLVEVEFNTLILLILAAVAGSWIGAGIVSGLPKRNIQIGMGVALLVAAVLMVLTALNRMPGGGDALALRGAKLQVAIVINFILGALMTLGIGAYAPIMIMISLMGMNPTAAFPIMMGSCALLMPTASAQFIRREKYDLRAAIGLAIGGIPAVVIAAYLVKSLPLAYVRWLVVVVVVYTGVALIRASRPSQQTAPTA